MFNTPSAPLGKVFRKEELEAIAAVVKKHPPLLVISDEAGVAMMCSMILNELFIYICDYTVWVKYVLGCFIKNILQPLYFSRKFRRHMCSPPKVLELGYLGVVDLTSLQSTL
jgi:hypothetical protein